MIYRSSVLAPLRRLVRGGRSDAPGAAVDLLGRVGLLAYGLVHLLVGWLALMAAFGVPDASADAQGAVAAIAETGFGALVLVLVTAGLLAFALWQVSSATLGRGYGVRQRAGAAAKAVACASLATVAAGFVDGRGEPSGDPGARSVTARILALPGGTVLLGLAGAVVLGLAAGMVYTGVRRTFLHDLDLDRLAPAARRGVEVVGAVGHLARAVALALIGVGVEVAAWTGNVREAGGLDAALRGLGSTGPGSWLLVVVAVGFVAYGVFCLADAATRAA
jgi:Domain of Unknown Function (DUF1206)